MIVFLQSIKSYFKDHGHAIMATVVALQNAGILKGTIVNIAAAVGSILLGQ